MATDYELVNAASQLEAGAKYVIGSADVTSAVFMGTKDNKNNRVQTPEVAITDGKITLTDTILVLELGGEADAWTFQTQNYHGTNGYLSNASSGTTNACFVQEAAMSFTIAFDGNKAVITSNGGNARNIMRYNSGSKCFACYASGQKDIYLYKEVASQGGEEPVVEPTETVYTPGQYNNWITTEYITEGSRLAWIAKKYYGNKVYWPYLYDANRDHITNPSNIVIGTPIRVPKLTAAQRDTTSAQFIQLREEAYWKVKN